MDSSINTYGFVETFTCNKDFMTGEPVNVLYVWGLEASKRKAIFSLKIRVIFGFQVIVYIYIYVYIPIAFHGTSIFTYIYP